MCLWRDGRLVDGRGFDNTADAFQFVYQRLSGEAADLRASAVRLAARSGLRRLLAAVRIGAPTNARTLPSGAVGVFDEVRSKFGR